MQPPFSFIIFLSLLPLYFPLLIPFDKSNTISLSKHFIKRDTLKLSYQIIDIPDISVTITSPLGKTLFTSTNPEDTWTYDITTEGEYTLAFRALSNGEGKSISFDFVGLFEKGYDLVEDKEVSKMEGNIRELGSLFNEIDVNMRYDLEKRDVHFKSMEEFVALINGLSISKIVAIVCLSLIQMAILYRLLSKMKMSDVFQNPFTNKRSIY